jgi:CheY-like chemotaxis protein
MLHKLIKTALIVDPNKYQAQLLSQTLQAEGVANVKHHPDAAEALQALALLSPCALFIEVDMAGMDGVALTKEIRRSRAVRNRRAPVFLMSQKASSLSLTQAMDVGANALLAKPIAPAVASAAIRRVMETPRPFIESKTYIGPCRRLAVAAVPNPCPRRREEDRALERLERMAERDELVAHLTALGEPASAGEPAAVAKARDAAARLAAVCALLEDQVLVWAAGSIARAMAEGVGPETRAKATVLFKALGLLADGASKDAKRQQVLDYIKTMIGAERAA